MDPLEVLVVPKSNNIEDHIRLQHIPGLLLIVGFWHDHFLNRRSLLGITNSRECVLIKYMYTIYYMYTHSIRKFYEGKRYCKTITVFRTPSLLREIWPFKPYCTR